MEALRMQIIPIILTIVFLAQSVYAGSMQEDYKQIVLRRQELEKKRSQYQIRLKTLSSERYKLITDIHSCISKKWNKEIWNPRLDEANKIKDNLEAERVKLADIRIAIDNVRQSLDQIRTEIEKKYKGKPRDAEYEAEFRAYMKALEDQYFTRMEVELFGGYETYFANVEKYLYFLKNMAETCRNDL